MTNPGNALGTNGAFGGRTTVNALNDSLAGYDGRGILSGWACEPVSGMTVALGGNHTTRDVAVAEDDAGNRTTINNRTNAPVEVTLEPAETLGQRIDTIVAYVQNPPQNPNKTPDNPECCSILAVKGDVAVTPVPPTEEQIRSAITADGGSGVTAYYVIMATITIPENATDITVAEIQPGPDANPRVDIDEELSEESENAVQNKVVAKALGNILGMFPLATDNIKDEAVISEKIDWDSVCEYTTNTINHWVVETWRFGNGLQIVKYIGRYTNASASIAWGSLFCGTVSPPDFPKPFIEVPAITRGWSAVSAGANAWLASRSENGAATEANPGGINIVRPVSATVTGDVNIIAIGRWK